jgi:hypothetical protein
MQSVVQVGEVLTPTMIRCGASVRRQNRGDSSLVLLHLKLLTTSYRKHVSRSGTMIETLEPDSV